METLGFRDKRSFTWVSAEPPVAAKDTLLRGGKRAIGTGQRAGRIWVKIRGERVQMALLTPQTRSWYGPIMEGNTWHREGAGTILRGYFRLTYPQMISVALFQLGIMGSGAEFILGGEFQRQDIAPEVAVCLAGAALIGAFLIPRLFWLTRRWKMEVINDHLTDCGFRVVQDPGAREGA